MKTCLKWMIAIAGIVLASGFQGGDMETLRTCIDNAKRYAQERNVDNAVELLESFRFHARKPEFRALQRKLRKQWRMALEHLDELAPDDMSKTLVLLSCWYMDEDEFGSFLLEVARLTEEDKVKPEIFRWCKCPPEDTPLDGYLQRHAKEPAMLEVEAKYEFVVEREKKRKTAEKEGTVPPGTVETARPGEFLPEGHPGEEGKARLWPSFLAGLAFLGVAGIWVGRRKLG